jgi:hypothetical protein
MTIDGEEADSVVYDNGVPRKIKVPGQDNFPRIGDPDRNSPG